MARLQLIHGWSGGCLFFFFSLFLNTVSYLGYFANLVCPMILRTDNQKKGVPMLRFTGAFIPTAADQGPVLPWPEGNIVQCLSVMR